VDIRHYWQVVKRRWKALAGCLLASAAVAAAVTFTATPTYAASARFLFSVVGETDSGNAYGAGIFAASQAASYAQVVNGAELAGRVSDRMGLTDEEAAALPGQVQGAADTQTATLTVTVTDTSAEQAALIAQAYAHVLPDFVDEVGTPAKGGSAPLKVTVVDSGSAGSTQVSPDPKRNLGLAVAVGLLLGVGLVALREALDDSVRSTEDVTRAAGATVLGTVAADPRRTPQPLVSELAPDDPRVEAFRVLRTSLEFADADVAHRGRAYVVAGCSREAGDPSTALNLALSIAATGQSAAYVEADLRDPAATSDLVPDRPSSGLASVLAGTLPLGEALQAEASSGLVVLGSGEVPADTSELIRSDAMSKVLSELQSEFAVVVVHAPPLLSVSDAAVLAALADGVVVEVRHGRTTADHLRQVGNRLEAVHARLTGVVLTEVPRSPRSRSQNRPGNRSSRQ